MKEKINIIFSQKIAELRKEHHLSQEDLAEKCNIHRTYIGSIERGEKAPTLNVIEKIANAFGISIMDMFQ